jgi:hypothetical protein
MFHSFKFNLKLFNQVKNYASKKTLQIYLLQATNVWVRWPIFVDKNKFVNVFNLKLTFVKCCEIFNNGKNPNNLNQGNMNAKNVFHQICTNGNLGDFVHH